MGDYYVSDAAKLAFFEQEKQKQKQREQRRQQREEAGFVFPDAGSDDVLDINDGDEWQRDTTTKAGKRGKAKGDKKMMRRRTKGTALDMSNESTKQLRDRYLVHTGVLTLIMFCFFTASASLVFNEYKSDNWTIHYWLEGDDSINGDSWSSANVGLWGGICAIIVLGLSLVVFASRTFCKFGRFGASWGPVKNNLAVWGPLALGQAFMTMAFTQVTGTSNLWSIVYMGAFALMSDWVGVSLRVLWKENRRYGSGLLGLLAYLGMKSLPLIYLALCATRNGLSTNITAAYWLFFAASTIKLCWFVGVFALAMITPHHNNLHVKLVFQSVDAYHNPLTVDVGPQKDTRGSLHSKKSLKKAVKYFMIFLLLANMVCVVLFSVGTTVGFQDTNRKVYERVTWTLTKPTANAVTYNVEFDRVWGVLQVALPIQFGALFLVLCYHLIFFDSFYNHMLNGSDVLSDMAYAVGDFFIVWATLNMTGTTEFSELLSASFLAFACCVVLIEARREYEWYFTLVPTLTFLLPMCHAAVNIAMLATRSSQELDLTALTFVVLGLRQLFFLWMRYRPYENVEGWYYYDQHPNKGIFIRYVLNWVVRWLVVAIWLSQAFHWGDDIINKK